MHLCRVHLVPEAARGATLLTVHCYDKRCCQQHSYSHSHCGLSTFLCFTSGRPRIKGTCDLKSSIDERYFCIPVFMSLHTWWSFSAPTQNNFSSLGVEPLWIDSIMSQGLGYFGLILKFPCLSKTLEAFLKSSRQSKTHHRRHPGGSTV